MTYVRFGGFLVSLLCATGAFGAAPVNAAPLSAPDDSRELDLSRFPAGPRYHPRPEGRRVAAGTPAIGTQRQWVGLDDTTSKVYPKSYRLRAVGRHIEVWVADDIAFPATDCRTDAVDVTDAQIAGLIHEFDDTIYPKETAAFSVPPDRDGTNATRSGDYTGDGDKTVTLVDNIRDDNFYQFPKAVTFVAGFFSPDLNQMFDRNVMTIDAYDWKHRFGAEPADEPTGNLCTSRPAHPRMYESTFAHEWQHLLEYYADPDEETWLNEGLADFAQTLVGYVDGRAGVNDPGNDNHLFCYQGFGPVKTKYNPDPRHCGGPQNSLNLWDEGAPSEVLADYGIVYQFMLYLRDRFGLPTITLLHRDGLRHGLAGVQAALPTGTALYDVLHDFQTMTLVDKIVGEPGGEMKGVPRGRVTADSVRSTVNLDNPTAFDQPGAAPNGADYVPLPTPLRSLSFEGGKTLPALPTGWTVAENTLFCGNTPNLDSEAVHPVTVPAVSPTLKLETAYALEDGYDFAYVSVSTDGGRTYTPVASDRNRKGALGPALTGLSGKVVTVSYDLSAYAGRKVLLSLRCTADDVVNRGGWRIGKITLGDKTVSDGTSLAAWRSPTAIVPTPVHAWHATLVGIDGHRARLVPINRWADLKAYPKVVAIIAYDEPTEKINRYAPYRLVVNGKLQPGGSTPTPAPLQPGGFVSVPVSSGGGSTP
ncbi:hypothetical protein Ate02nite_34320 [Paractinoplanes tereljensis]|uniref:Immune inhibitor A peptidase M6 n=1 Tax=Paractinoplanes tereljensis TaxID=571912 RepID=A0A919NMU6_9ACTN|nr:hypothetical protein Ate02nite_34320 [Actinoplanes tereljensis]